MFHVLAIIHINCTTLMPFGTWHDTPVLICLSFITWCSALMCSHEIIVPQSFLQKHALPPHSCSHVNPLVVLILACSTWVRYVWMPHACWLHVGYDIACLALITQLNASHHARVTSTVAMAVFVRCRMTPLQTDTVLIFKPCTCL